MPLKSARYLPWNAPHHDVTALGGGAGCHSTAIAETMVSGTENSINCPIQQDSTTVPNRTSNNTHLYAEKSDVWTG